MSVTRIEGPGTQAVSHAGANLNHPYRARQSAVMSIPRAGPSAPATGARVIRVVSRFRPRAGRVQVQVATELELAKWAVSDGQVGPGSLLGTRVAADNEGESQAGKVLQGRYRDPQCVPDFTGSSGREALKSTSGCTTNRLGRELGDQKI